MSPAKVHFFGATHPGMLRSNNEDAIGWDEALQLAIVADGMGGHNAGEVASAMTIEQITATLRQQSGSPLSLAEHKSLIDQAVTLANQQVNQQAQADAAHKGMGTTVVMAQASGDRLLFAHVGDSRLYRLRSGRFKQLTEDHSLVNQLIAQGTLSKEEAATSRYRNVITRAIGHKPEVEVEINQCKLLPGDLYLLCSDGLYEMLSKKEIKQILIESADQHPLAIQTLLNRANQNGGRDNISAVIVKAEH